MKRRFEPTVRSGAAIGLVLVFGFMMVRLVTGCSEVERIPGRGSTALAVRILFPGAGGAMSPERAATGGVEQIVVRVAELQDGNLLSPAALESIDVRPEETSFSFTLRVPPAPRYRVDVRANGLRGSGGSATLRGILYAGSAEVLDLEEGESAEARVNLVDLVPHPRVALTPTVYTISWDLVPGAAGYRLLEQAPDGLNQAFEFAETERSFEFPPAIRRGGGGGGRFRYRVQSTGTRFSSAFSESVGVSVPGPVPPGAIDDLTVSTLTDSSVVLSWTASGDDGEIGQASSYELRGSRAPIDEGNFESALLVPGLDPPGLSGVQQGVFIDSLEAETSYFFALRTFDDAGLRSEISNVVEFTTPAAPDRTPPSAVTDLAATALDENRVELTWVSSGDDGVAGQATRYDIRRSDAPITEDTFENAIPIEDAPAPSPPLTGERFVATGFEREQTYFFALRTLDEVPNRSPISNVPFATTPDQTPPNAVRDLRLRDRQVATVRLNWTAPGDDGDIGTAERYDLRRALTPIDDRSFEAADRVADVPDPGEAGANEAIDVTGLTSRTVYYFAQKSVDNAGNASLLSNVLRARTRVEAPENLSANAKAADEIGLAWNFTPPPERFVLERATESGEFDTRFDLPNTSDTYLDGGLAALTTYRYRIRAYADGDSSEPSNEAGATTLDEAPLCSITPNVLDFGTVRVGEFADRSFLLANTGGGTLVGDILEEELPFFLVSGGGPYALTRGQSIEVTYRFRPAIVGSAQAVFSVGGGCEAVSLEGIGDDDPRCAVTPPAASYDFGLVPIGSPADFVFTVQNAGGDTLSGTITLSGCNKDYSFADGGGAYALRAGETHSSTLRYQPSFFGAADCVVNLGADCGGIVISGAGQFCTVNPESLDFGHARPGEWVDLWVDVENVSDQNLTISPFFSAENGCGPYSITSNGGTYLMLPHTVRRIGLRYFPTYVGTHTCNLNVSSYCGPVPLVGVSP